VAARANGPGWQLKPHPGFFPPHQAQIFDALGLCVAGFLETAAMPRSTARVSTST